MTSTKYQNYSIWHQLKKCIVGKSWPVEFYQSVQDKNIRTSMETIAIETEQGYQNLIKILESFGVEVIRPEIPEDLSCHNFKHKPPNAPGDYMIMLGDKFIETYNCVYPNKGEIIHQLDASEKPKFYNNIFNDIQSCGNEIISLTNPSINNAMIFQLGKKIYFSSWNGQNRFELQDQIRALSDSRDAVPFHLRDHIDGWFCPVTPGLIVSSTDSNGSALLNLFYKTNFPDWEVVYIEPSMQHSSAYQRWLSRKNNARWWLNDQENNSQLINFIDTYLESCLGNVQETVFEVNIVIINQKNVIVDRYNEKLFEKLLRYNVTPHICPLKHKEFWDSGLHCAVCELHRIDKE